MENKGKLLALEALSAATILKPVKSATHIVSELNLNSSGLAIASHSEPQARGYLSEEQALKIRALPLRIEYHGGERILVAGVGATNIFESKTKLHFATGIEIVTLAFDDQQLELAIHKAYQGDNSVLIKRIDELKEYTEQHQALAHQVAESVSEGNQVTRFIARLIEYAAAHHASDIHLTPRSEGAFVKLRIDGDLLDHADALTSLEVYRQLVSRIKILAQLDTTIRTLPQDGRFVYALHNRSVELRVSTLPTIHGENIVLRVFAGGKVHSLESLGYDERIVRSIGRFISGPCGLMLVSGPTGSGKTSALYAVVSEMKRKNFIVATIEDPVEITLSGVVQTSISESAGLTYLSALKAVLRQDPDAILIGELRDPAAVKSALDAAMSGHHVLSTIHGARVVDVLRRLESLGADRLTVYQSLSIIITQRLVNQLCQMCKIFDLRSANSIGCDAYQPVGCSQCSYTGYFGKQIIAEALFFDEEIRERLSFATQVTTRFLRELAGAQYLLFQDQCLNALERGEISYQQYLELC